MLRTAAADPLAPHEARGAYQVAVYYRLDSEELEALFIETFHGGLQQGMYRNMALGGLMTQPDAAEVAPRLVSEVLEDPFNELAPEVLGMILGAATTLSRDRFTSADRQRIWALIDPRLESLPPEMREVAESHAADLTVGPA